MKKGRIFLIVLDSCGAGEMPDARRFGDEGANTIRSASMSPEFKIDVLKKMGYGNIDGLDFLGREDNPTAATGKLAEASNGKDTTVGHWEIAGIISEAPLPTYPRGFPKEITDEFTRLTGRGILCNKPFSGTEVIKEYGREHLETGRLIVYTSADSVFQIAAHESVMSDEELYECCAIARKILCGRHAVGRVIARPFAGVYPDYVRTAGRRDFSLVPPEKTMLDALCENGYDTIAVGKINDIFAGKGISKAYASHGNAECMQATDEITKQDFNGICFINLVDFDMLYGHRRDVDGYARALTVFDGWLGNWIKGMRDDDILMITADHGCDPAFLATTDHTREYVPVIVYGKKIKPANLGTRDTYADIAATVTEYFGASLETKGKSFLGDILA